MINNRFVRPFAIGAAISLALVASAIFIEPLLTRNQSVYACPGVAGIPTSFHGDGFIVSRPTGFANGMQFVITPNSTAFLQITYSISDNSENITAQSIYSNWSTYFTPVKYWYKLGSNPSPGLNTSEVGMTATPVNVTATGKYILTATYEVSALANAKQGAYITNIFSTCGPQIVLTVGYSLYNGPGLTGVYL